MDGDGDTDCGAAMKPVELRLFNRAFGSGAMSEDFIDAGIITSITKKSVNDDNGYVVMTIKMN